MEDFKLGGYLLSCLTKAGYYGLYNMLRSDFKFEYALSVRKKSVRDYAESDPYTSEVPFPPWTSAVDEKGKVLVKPSKDQLKRTVWQPHPNHFDRSHGREILDMESIHPVVLPFLEEQGAHFDIEGIYLPS